jgi:hypothetical protein
MSFCFYFPGSLPIPVQHGQLGSLIIKIDINFRQHQNLNAMPSWPIETFYYSKIIDIAAP